MKEIEGLRYGDLSPAEIEKKSFEMIREELDKRGIVLEEDKAPVVMRAIHTTADLDYACNLCFSENAVDEITEAIRSGFPIVTDTQMARSGINMSRLKNFGCSVFCYMQDEDIARESAGTGRTRAYLSMDKAAGLGDGTVFVIGNAPTALIRLYELVREEGLKPGGIIGVPVGFVNVTEAKELIMTLDCPYIVAKGKKGGSNVAAAIINALVIRALG
ncbi:MAG: precorrin-8X methylmutase [Lachnospiraceae bacterium]|nr:precorrin-8X methylmutase [Lachnospiraceae bacterium]